MKLSLFPVLCLATAVGLVACSSDSQSPAIETAESPSASGDLSVWPALKQTPVDPALESRIDGLLASLTLEQKVGQMIQPEIHHALGNEVRDYYLGSVLNGGGSFPQQNKHASLDDWLALADDIYAGSMAVEAGTKIPAFWGTDAVHGHNNVIGATLFPHNIGLGAAHDPALIKRIGAATAREMAATGIIWSFAPTIAVARDDRWGRTYESYSESPALVAEYARAMVEGLQGERDSAEFLADGKVISTAKHFVGDGGTAGGSDRGDTQISEAELARIHSPGYFTAIEAGVQVVMASFSSWNGDRMHGHRYLLTDVLKGKLGFDGFVVGDWMGHQFVPGCSATHCPAAVNAGLDMFMASDPNWRELHANTVADVKAGRISMERIDDAVRRILRVKLRAGLFERGAPSTYKLAADTTVMGNAEHRAIAREAVQKSLVMLKNAGQILPLSPKQHIVLAGDGAHNIGKQSGGWTITWQGTGNSNDDFPGASSIYDGFAAAVKAAGGSIELAEDGNYQQKPDVAVVVYGEDPYAEMQGDTFDLGYRSPENLALLKKFNAEGIPVVSLFISGRPLAVNPYLNASDAFVAVWLPGSEGVGVADVVLARADGSVNVPFSGKLSFSWPRNPQQAPQNPEDAGFDPLFAQGYGLAYGDEDSTAYPLPTHRGEIYPEDANELPLFVYRPVKPWNLLLQDTAGDSHAVNTASVRIDGLNLNMQDRHVQEDTLHLAFTGQARAGFYVDEAMSLESFAGGSWVFEAVVDKADALTIGLDCDGCGQVALSAVAEVTDQWQTLRIPVACVADDLSKVKAAFYVQGQKGAALSLYNLRLTKGDASCPANLKQP
ncbi:glycoside hydrolase family 3 protein [Simiduia agarivorans]|uniref:Glucan 1,4-beta-glucosidase n=1 Tax=Simiduia agarivorans (strain DSM 21679 / JCM 13881 / BCRC 17597 / SA1) TaxID=1117647 RepID=K4KP51_SIMAS|nr:glycoside hydrolase family 3 N-terminal domain-containing protein [Simiduia agarivorans]AFV00797.1 glucan 1,4-beta-glucosidase [Simiduia agarivorans SA1 = DSM 21679]